MPIARTMRTIPLDAQRGLRPALLPFTGYLFNINLEKFPLLA
jgi:hypothetical protein